MEERAQRIVDAALELAEEGGFQAVRLRDVAARSGVAFGTLYARFNSKEDILIAALEQETGKFRLMMENAPSIGANPVERARNFFTILSQTLFTRTGFARAVLRSVASGVPDVADKVIRYQDTISDLIIAALRGGNEASPSLSTSDAEQLQFIARMMQNIWFAELISWMSEVSQEDEVIERTVRGATLMLQAAGFDRECP